MSIDWFEVELRHDGALDATCDDCGGLWPDFCSCPDRDDDVQARDEANRDDS